MTSAEIRDRFVHELTTIAPEADPAAIAPTVPLRDQLDIDSFDFLNLVIALDKTLGVSIPESDYAKLATLDGAVAYLAARLSA
ncbi:MAG TPA: acyl carrier protein [Polyangia bacterium]